MLAESIFKYSTSAKTQNLSPFDQVCKLRSILLYGKAVFDEKTKEFQLPVQLWEVNYLNLIVDISGLIEILKGWSKHSHQMISIKMSKKNTTYMLI